MPDWDSLAARKHYHHATLKLKVAIGALVWTLFISALHVQLNVGWAQMVTNLQVAVGAKRAEMVVGFLPVT